MNRATALFQGPALAPALIVQTASVSAQMEQKPSNVPHLAACDVAQAARWSQTLPAHVQHVTPLCRLWDAFILQPVVCRAALLDRPAAAVHAVQAHVSAERHAARPEALAAQPAAHPASRAILVPLAAPNVAPLARAAVAVHAAQVHAVIVMLCLVSGAAPQGTRVRYAQPLFPPPAAVFLHRPVCLAVLVAHTVDDNPTFFYIRRAITIVRQHR